MANKLLIGFIVLAAITIMLSAYIGSDGHIGTTIIK
jgi:hypothetical protein